MKLDLGWRQEIWVFDLRGYLNFSDRWQRLKSEGDQPNSAFTTLGGAGIPNGSMFTIRQNNQDYIVNTAGMRTVEDLINGIQATGARVNVSLDPTGRYLAMQSTERYDAVDHGGRGDIASRLGIRTFDLSTPGCAIKLWSRDL